MPTRRPGPVYDGAMKLLAEDDLSAILSVVGVDGRGAEPVATELPGTATRADLLAQTRAGIVHVEFVKDSAPDLDLRMLDYRLRLRRRDRRIPIQQYVLALTEVAVPDCYADPDVRGPVCSWSSSGSPTSTPRVCSPRRRPPLWRPWHVETTPSRRPT